MITHKQDQIKARLVARGYQESVKPKADAPTASREALRVCLSLTANEKFDRKVLDVTSAFLQSNPIDRIIIIQPPKYIKKEGKVWKLKKACYGLVDASRQFYLSVKKELEMFGMKMVELDEALVQNYLTMLNCTLTSILNYIEYLKS